MSILPELTKRFHVVLSEMIDDPDSVIDMLRTSQDPKFGDYQANFAMPLGKKLGRQPREIAAEIIERVDLSDLCETPEIAGPGFINLKVRDDWIVGRIEQAVKDDRLGVPATDSPKTYVVDFSAPNVAKPMHVGHVRSTVIGNSLTQTLRFAGHQVVTDNHIGDWGTQFGMLIYGYRSFVDEAAYADAPVDELARLYKLVRKLIDYHNGVASLPKKKDDLVKLQADLEKQQEEAYADGKKPDKKTKKAFRRTEEKIVGLREGIESLAKLIEEVDASPQLTKMASENPTIAQAVLQETAKLHSGDESNLALWHEFMPPCLEEIQRVYDRLNISFDNSLGESFYNDMLGPIVDELLSCGAAKESDGAICVFFEGADVPMLVRKKDGAFLYATTDLATIRYRMQTWKPDAILYVVDHRQSMHFKHLFTTAGLIGFSDIEMRHVKFGTVMGEDGKPFKTRSGDTVGLDGLLNKAVARAADIVAENDDAKKNGPELDQQERDRVAETVGLAAITYADLSQNRESDYVFSYDKMMATKGNTAAYMQYVYARVSGIFMKSGVDIESLRASNPKVVLGTPAERNLALGLLKFSEAIELVLKDYRPNYLTDYLFDLSNRYSTFYNDCPVMQAETEELRDSRLLLCDLTARTISKGLELLGIRTVDRM
jgi:arginyl-tRNA synthetase